MSQYIKNFQKFRPLLAELVSRDVKIKYRKSVLGVLWTLLNPLLMMVVLSFVFSHLMRFNVKNYPLFILSGQLVYNFFSESTSSAMSAILNNAPLIKKVYIPKYLFVLSRIASSVVNIMASVSALIFMMLFMKVELHYTIFLGIIPIFFLIIFSTGVGLILATVTVKFRDIMHLYGVFLTALTYLTPVIYPISFLQSSRIAYTVVNVNPLTNMLTMFRDLVLYGTIPSISSFMLSFVTAMAALVIGLVVFYKKQDKFILNI
ncbi:MAG: ABC transporter permease [Hespellia sp.]|nr:ABC transporter permease [Hespellia sp.]